MTDRTKRIARLKAAIEALQAQRSLLGDDVVDLSMKALQEQLTALEAASATTPPEGERRQATILFSDLSGYTAINEKLDPEVVQELMNRIRAETIRIVEHHGGTINQFIGDEVLALFGIPQSHEDDPVRAVKAAMELHAAVRAMSGDVEPLTGRPLTLHSGLNTGLILTTARDEWEGKYGLTGDTINTGARLADLAQADEILVSQETQRLIAPYFRTESLDPVLMKGKTDPVIPYRIVGKTKVHTRLEAAEQRGFTPFIGRDQELATLRTCLEKTMRGGGQLVTVRGSAGLGKSRLLYEFRHQLDRRRVTVLQGRCQSHGVSRPYLPFQDTLRRGLQLRDEDSPKVLEEKMVRNMLKVDRALEKYIPVFLHLLSIPSEKYPLPKELTGEQLKLSIQEALVAINTLNTRRLPMVLILEDWHWADEGSDIALQKLLEVLPSFPLMIVLLFRPEYTPKWGQLPFHTPIDLSSVDEKSVATMIQAIFGVEEVPGKFASQIYKRSGGNPFFIEELCSLLKEEGTVRIQEGKVRFKEAIEQITLPESVQAVIRAKLDRLDDESKEVMRLASVIGREFLCRILEQITTRHKELPSSLENLERIDFIRQIKHLPELTYQFNHVITQEVTYQTILIRQRPLLHRLVAESIEVLYAERLEEQYEALAYHYRRSENWEKALHYLDLSGDKAARTFSMLEARTYYWEAIQLLDAQLTTTMPQLPFQKARRIKITLKWAPVSFYAGQEEMLPILETSLAYAHELNGQAMAGQLHYWLGQRHMITGSLAKAKEHYTAGIELGRQANDKALLAQAYAALGRISHIQAEYRKAQDYLTKSIPLLVELGEKNDAAYAAGFLSGAYVHTGHFDQALAFAEKGVEMAKETGNLSRLAQAYLWLGYACTYQGNWEKCQETVNRSLDIARPLGDVITVFLGYNLLGYCFFMLGKRKEGLSKMEEGIELMMANKIYLFYSYPPSFVAYCYALDARKDKAREMAFNCLNWAEKFWKGFECLAYYALALAEAQNVPHDPEKVDEMITKGLDRCRQQGQGPFLAQGYFEYARILAQRGDREKAQDYLNLAKKMFREMKMFSWLEQAENLKKAWDGEGK